MAVQGTASSCVVQLPDERKRASAAGLAATKHAHESVAALPSRPSSADAGAQSRLSGAELSGHAGALAAAQRLYFRVVAANRGGMSLPGAAGG